MAQNVAVSYAVNMTGNLAPQANQAAGAVQNLGNAANKAMPHLGGLTMAQSNMVSQAETVISMFGQMGGSISQAAILASSGIRPFAMLAANIGMAGAAALGFTAIAGIVAVASMVKLTSATLALATAAGEAGDELRELGLLTAEQSSFANQMEQSTAALAVTQDLLTVRLASSAEVVGNLHHAYVGLWAVAADGVQTLSNVAAGLTDLHREIVRGTPLVGEYAAKWLEFIGPGNGNVGINPGLNFALKKLAERGKEAADELERAKRAKDEILIYGPEAPEGMLPGAIFGPDLPPGMGIYGRPPKESKRKGPSAADMALFGRQERFDADMARLQQSDLSGMVSFDDPLMPVLDANTKAQLEANLLAAQAAHVTQEQIDAANQLREAMLQADAAARGPSAVGALGSVLSGDMNQVIGFGLQQAGMAGDPVMMATSMILQALPGLEDTLRGLFEQVMTTYTDLDDIIGGIASELVPELIRASPEMAAAFITLAPAIVAELVAAAPEISRAVVDAIYDIPDEIARALADILSPFNGGDGDGPGRHAGRGGRTGTAIGVVIGGLAGGPAGAVAGGIVGGAIGSAVGGRKDPVELGQARGSSSQARSSRGGHVTVVVQGDTRQSARNLRRALGTYGLNETLEGPV